MKKIIVFLCFLFILSDLFAQGLHFETLTYKEALAKAKAENKLIFVDCYASWCLPCKDMLNTVFTQKKIGDFFNSRFINVKYDIEKEGRELANEFSVSLVPTFLLITPDGKLQHRLCSKFTADEFIEKINRGISPESSLSYMDELYKSGKMTTIELRDYIVALLDAYRMDNLQELTAKLLAELSDKEKLTSASWPIFSSLKLSPLFSENFDYLYRNKAVFETTIGKEKVQAYFNLLCEEYFFKAIAVLKNYNQNYNKQELLKISSMISDLPAEWQKPLLAKKNLLVAMGLNDVPLMLDAFLALGTYLQQDELIRYAYISQFAFDRSTKSDAKKLVKVIEQYEQLAKDEQLKAYINTINKKYRKNYSTDGIYFDDMLFSTALAYATGLKRPFFVCFYMPESRAYKYLEKNIFVNDEIGNLLKVSQSLKINAATEEGKKLIASLQIGKIPSCVLIGGDGKVCWQQSGKITPEKFLAELKKVMKVN